MTRFSRLFLCLALIALLGACAGNDTTRADAKKAAEKQLPVETLYNDAAAALDSGQYQSAAQGFEQVEQQYPYSQWATRAQLMTGFAYYKNLKYDNAIISLDRYIELHPGDENVAYAYYLKALCYYEQITDVRRDQKMTALAMENLKRVVERFPDSKYARDAKLKLDLTQDHLAGKEMEVGRYYLDRKQYQAAINRFQRVVTNFQTTTHVPEALHRMTESYLALGIYDEAKKTAAVLGHNYPHSSWYRDSYKLMTGKTDGVDDKSVFDKTIGRIF